MATYSITVYNTMTVLGGSRTNTWGDAGPSLTTLVWQSAGAATQYTLWGTQEDLEISVTKGISNSLNFATDPDFQVTKQINNSLDMSSTVGKNMTKQFDNTMGLASSANTITHSSGDWDYVYPDDTTNVASFSTSTYTSVTASTTTWTEVSITTSSWTEV